MEYKEMICEIGDIPFSVLYRYEDIEQKLTTRETKKKPLFSVKITEDMLSAERQKEKQKTPEPYLEGLTFFRKFCEEAAFLDAILFHSCALEVGGKAYLFAAPSGTGKSTHARLWLECFKEKAKILNGDKPLIRIVDGQPVVYDTSFRGKENYGYKGCATLGGICFLNRGMENSIRRITSSEAVRVAYLQTYLPNNAEKKAKVMETLIRILNSTPLYFLQCNISKEAARLTYTEMTGERV